MITSTVSNLNCSHSIEFRRCYSRTKDSGTFLLMQKCCIRESYGGKLKVYKTDIPRSVRAEEISAEGTSIFKHDPKGKVAEAYKVLTKEVLHNAEKRRKHQLEGVR